MLRFKLNEDDFFVNREKNKTEVWDAQEETLFVTITNEEIIFKVDVYDDEADINHNITFNFKRLEKDLIIEANDYDFTIKDGIKVYFVHKILDSMNDLAEAELPDIIERCRLDKEHLRSLIFDR